MTPETAPKDNTKMASPRIEFHRYLTPSEANSGGDKVYSVGVINLTLNECEAIAAMVRRLEEARRIAGSPFATAGDWAKVDLVRLNDDLEKEEAARDAARQPEPDEPRNRFSGLDLD